VKPSPDFAALPVLGLSQAVSGAIIAYKNLEFSEETKWQPRMSDFKIATVIGTPQNSKLLLSLEEEYKPKKHYDPETGERIYSKFQIADMEESLDAEDGTVELDFGELTEPKLVKEAVNVANGTEGPAANVTVENDTSGMGIAEVSDDKVIKTTPVAADGTSVQTEPVLVVTTTVSTEKQVMATPPEIDEIAREEASLLIREAGFHSSIDPEALKGLDKPVAAEEPSIDTSNSQFCSAVQARSSKADDVALSVNAVTSTPTSQVTEASLTDGMSSPMHTSDEESDESGWDNKLNVQGDQNAYNSDEEPSLASDDDDQALIVDMTGEDDEIPDSEDSDDLIGAPSTTRTLHIDGENKEYWSKSGSPQDRSHSGRYMSRDDTHDDTRDDTTLQTWPTTIDERDGMNQRGSITMGESSIIVTEKEAQAQEVSAPLALDETSVHSTGSLFMQDSSVRVGEVMQTQEAEGVIATVESEKAAPADLPVDEDPRRENDEPGHTDSDDHGYLASENDDELPSLESVLSQPIPPSAGRKLDSPQTITTRKSLPSTAPQRRVPSAVGARALQNKRTARRVTSLGTALISKSGDGQGKKAQPIDLTLSSDPVRGGTSDDEDFRGSVSMSQPLPRRAKWSDKIRPRTTLGKGRKRSAV